jgi:biotin operon repressor
MNAPDQTMLLNHMAQHQGRLSGIGAEALAQALGMSPRKVRKLVTELREERGVAICGHPARGYYMATTPEELAHSCKFLERRALTSLRLLSRMRGVSMPDLVGQLKLNQA